MVSTDVTPMIPMQKGIAQDWAEPFRVRYGKYDLGLHMDVRLCLLRASEAQKSTCVVTISESEEEMALEKTPGKRCKRESLQVQSECLAPKRLRR